MITTPAAPAGDEQKPPEWAEQERRVIYKCERCKMNRPVILHRQFIRPTITEEHMNAWGYPCSNVTLSLQP